MERLISALGLAVFIGLSYAFSINRRAVLWRSVLWGLGSEFVLALLILKTPGGLAVFKFLGDVVSRFLEFSDVGAKFVFGEKFAENFFAFKVLPTIIFFSAFISVLYHYGILQRLVKTLAGNIFLGPTEAPLLVKPYVTTMTKSELHAVMTGGFATIAAGVLGAYLSFGIPAEHLIAAFFMTAPTALVVSKLLYPETEVPMTAGSVGMDVDSTYVNVIDAAATGALDGAKLAVNVAVMIICFFGVTSFCECAAGMVGEQY